MDATADSTPQKLPFDTDLALAKAIRGFNGGMGMSATDINTLLGVLHEAGYLKPSYKNSAGLARYEKALLAESTGTVEWRAVEVVLSNGMKVTVHVSSMVEALKAMYSDSANKDGFVVKPAAVYTSDKKQRIYAGPETGDGWIKMQEECPRGGVIAACILYSDGTNLSNDGRVTGHPVALWGFRGGHSLVGNPYRSLLVEVMHALDLGVFLHIVSCIRAYYARDREFLRTLDIELQRIATDTRISGFRIPSSEKGGYFAGAARFQAFEHRAVMQVITVVLANCGVPNSIVGAVAAFVDCYMLASRRWYHTTKTLQELDAAIKRLIPLLKDVFAGLQKSEFDITKVHSLAHVVEDIIRSGVPMHYSANMYEYLHQPLVKRAYRASNKRDPIPQIAMESGHNTLAATSFSVSWKESIADGCDKWKAHALAAPGDMTKLKGLLEGTAEEGEVLNSTIRVKNSMAIPGDEDFTKYSSQTHYVRACASFGDKPWFSDVAVLGEEEVAAAGGEITKRKVIWYARLLLLFTIDVYTPLTKAFTKRAYAFVRYLRATGAVHASKCPVYAWEAGENEYQLLELDNILRVAHMVGNATALPQLPHLQGLDVGAAEVTADNGLPSPHDGSNATAPDACKKACDDLLRGPDVSARVIYPEEDQFKAAVVVHLALEPEDFGKFNDFWKKGEWAKRTPEIGSHQEGFQLTAGSLSSTCDVVASPSPRNRHSLPSRCPLLPSHRRHSILSRRRPSLLHAVAAPSLPAVASPSLPAVASPSLPTVASPSLPAVASPSLPAVASPSLPSVASPSLPAVASPSLPAVASPSLPAVASPSVPAVASPSVPAVASPSLPSVASPSVPAVASPSVPAVASPSLPAVASPSLPAVASPSLPAVASPSLPAVASPSLPAVASPSVPAVASPSLPAVASPSLPAVASPSLPAVASPSLPAVASPSLPAVASPSLPAVASPSLPAVASPSLPAVASPSVPAVASPSLPAVASPSVPAVASPSVPAVASPSLPAFASPSLPAVASPSLPAVASPSLPAVASPSLPAVASPSLPAVASGECTSASASRCASAGWCVRGCASAGWCASAGCFLRHRGYQVRSRSFHPPSPL
ncbi:unnamed protein product [Closterium sp. NIES-65]|nr:unnamed protein product [Closterium sp. NIES-65]